jgi:hypothetical protein
MPLRSRGHPALAEPQTVPRSFPIVTGDTRWSLIDLPTHFARVKQTQELSLSHFGRQRVQHRPLGRHLEWKAPVMLE